MHALQAQTPARILEPEHSCQSKADTAGNSPACGLPKLDITACLLKLAVAVLKVVDKPGHVLVHVFPNLVPQLPTNEAVHQLFKSCGKLLDLLLHVLHIQQRPIRPGSGKSWTEGVHQLFKPYDKL